MINHIDTTFHALHSQGKKALIAFVTAGFPTLPRSADIITCLLDNGADIVEIGIPFSDPIADGPTIQYSSQQALRNHASLTRLVPWMIKLGQSVQSPLVCMGYLNPFFQYGLDRLSRDLSGSINGIIVPDLPIEESKNFRAVFTRKRIHCIQLVTPVTPIKRCRTIMQSSSGFVYAVSTTGVTGARRSIARNTVLFLEKLKKNTDLPVALGFGISKPAQVSAVRRYCDGIIVGSAFINIIRDHNGSGLFTRLKKYTRSLQQALNP
ncbi:MAG: tryptophan synthase subunit alpha [Elusimicrobia bacterium]|nr:tryptophan synthase subunit alpha [Elusimicrobiota bacterium]MBD3412691.1 tryptophan synthase subunit alpha [Elusimicrobiota bacterium]